MEELSNEIGLNSLTETGLSVFWNQNNIRAINTSSAGIMIIEFIAQLIIVI
jgi:hypothetical protein